MGTEIKIPHLEEGETHYVTLKIDGNTIENLRIAGLKLQKTPDGHYLLDWDYTYFMSDNYQVFKQGATEEALIEKYLNINI